MKRTRVVPCEPSARLVDAEHANAVVLARAADLDDPVRGLHLDERDVAPAEAVAGRLDPKARAGAEPDRVDPREMPVDEVVVGELGMVGDVVQVVEDLLAGGSDDDRHCQGVHGTGSLDVRKAAG